MSNHEVEGPSLQLQVPNVVDFFDESTNPNMSCKRLHKKCYCKSLILPHWQWAGLFTLVETRQEPIFSLSEKYRSSGVKHAKSKGGCSLWYFCQSDLSKPGDNLFQYTWRLLPKVVTSGCALSGASSWPWCTSPWRGGCIPPRAHISCIDYQVLGFSCACFSS
jgi:hypothetical protein